MDVLVLSIGLLLLILIIYDFFFTTLSGSGAGFISKNVASLTYRAMRKFAGPTNRKTFEYSGMIVNLCVLFVWIVIVWAGLFLVYSYDPDAITNSSSRPANWVERLYFTGYVLSTLGLGNFKPITPFFEIMTGIFSFFGFIFFTSSMTYLISVSSAVIRKRTLSRSISTLGKKPSEIADKLKNLQPSYRDQQILSLQEQITSHLVSHQAYPVVHFFSHQNPENCFNLNFVRLDEAVTILLKEDRENIAGTTGKDELQLLRSTMSDLLMHMKENFSASLPKPEGYTDVQDLEEATLEQRRKLLLAMLKSEEFEWSYVK
ncbi:Ion channel [Salinimicrobium catena]|uniref:Ion channel n=1 Tax=Salinimicrobium catena TaxID=390640 RepID=A0A1H5HRV1_9FLAO|nr:ion channel [Salinimicrobium catena]SDK72127.1 Ion channel [Salinimicrobium catena]SEE30534.1 Ion channel [Salinimicrobium catena]